MSRVRFNGRNYRYTLQASVAGTLLIAALSGCGPAAEFQEGDEVTELSNELRLTGTASASSSENSTLGPEKAVDNDTGTRWSSAFADNQWIRIDLGSVRAINRVVLRWEAAYSSQFDVQFSNDGSTWSTVASRTRTSAGTDDVAVSGSARYVRMFSHRRGTAWGNSLWEFEVHAPDPTAPPPTGGIALPAKIEAEKPHRFSDTTPTNIGTNQSCSTNAVDTETTTDMGGGCNVGWTEPGEWLEWDVSAASSGKFDIVARVASQDANKTLHFELDGARVGGTLTAPAAGWQGFRDVIAPGVAISAGTHKLRLFFDSGLVNVNYLDVKTASTTPPPSARSCKRGVAFGRHTSADLTALSRGISWWYNWARHPESGVSGMYGSVGVEFVPMTWDEQDWHLKNAAGTNGLPSGVKTLLGFNEPNFYSQANLSPQRAADFWRYNPSSDPVTVEDVARPRGLKIASPAVNFCGPADECHDTDPFRYLHSFFAACSGCQVDYIALHWYACDLPALKWYIGEAKRQFPGKPIWLTEFACGDNTSLRQSADYQRQYLLDAVSYLESEPAVMRYAWFADAGAFSNPPAPVNLVNGSGLTPLGQAYVNAPAASCQ